jgi:cobalamin biosynthesis Mg chelatase CobN
MKLLKKLRGSKEPSANSGEKQMKLLRRLPKILKFIPGKAQDLRAWFLTMQYWLGGSDDNVEQMVRFLSAPTPMTRPSRGPRPRRRSITPRWAFITPISRAPDRHRFCGPAEPGKSGGDGRPPDDAELRAGLRPAITTG